MTDKPIRVAVVGAGAAGMAAAWLASRNPAVQLSIFESRHQLGGHANTVEVDGVPVDTGFLVFNEGSYPNLCGLFEELGVFREPSDMSFCVSLAGRSFEWSSDSLNALFATRSNLVSPTFYSMIKDMVRFHDIGPEFLKRCEADTAAQTITLQEFLDSYNFGQAVRVWYLIPHAAAVWSASERDVLDFPAKTFIQFFQNHSLLQLIDRPQWYTVAGRSREYLRRIVASMPAERTTIHLSNAIKSIRRVTKSQQTTVFVEDAHGTVHEFDQLILGCHPDEALSMLQDPSEEERAALSGFKFQDNTAYLHTDTALMPSRRVTWSAWNYIGKGQDGQVSETSAEPCCVSYWLNRLQNLPAEMPQLFVTLNPSNAPAPDKVLKELHYAHPQYTTRTIAAQKAVEVVQGKQSTWFCGAYLGYGFHEDAITSGLRVAAKISGQTPPWWGRPMYAAPTIREQDYQHLDRLSRKEDDWLARRNDILRSAGGPYWRDNRGNGGPVGLATDRILKVWLAGNMAVEKFTEEESHTATYPKDVLAAFNAHSNRHAGLSWHSSSPHSTATTCSAADTAFGTSPRSALSTEDDASKRTLELAMRAFTVKLPRFIYPDGFDMHAANLMASGSGGYTVQPLPIHSPASWGFSNVVWVYDIARRAALRYLCKPVVEFLKSSIKAGNILLRFPDGAEMIIGNPTAPASQRARIRVHSWHFFFRVATEADLGLARSFMAAEWSTDDLTALFSIFIANREQQSLTASRLWTSWVGTTVNYLLYCLSMDNSLSGSRKNIHAHYDLSNDLFTTFLDPLTMMYSCAVFDVKRRYVQRSDIAQEQPTSFLPLEAATLSSTNVFVSGKQQVEVMFAGDLSEAQLRKLDHLIARAKVRPSDYVLDLGFGWGGLSIRLAETVGCRVHGITLSKEQLELATKRVAERGFGHLITFELADYREFAAKHARKFDRIISVEMIEAVGKGYMGSFIKSLDSLLAPNGLVVLQAITIPDSRYEEYCKSTDFINSIIFPGGHLPCLSAFTQDLAKNSTLLISNIDEFGLHYAETLRRWRANFNAVADTLLPRLGFDDKFIRTWNYYLCYCEAGFQTHTLGLQVWTLTRPNNPNTFGGSGFGSLFVDAEQCINTEADALRVPACCF